MGVETMDSGFKLAICGDTWGTGSFSGAQCHGPLKASTSTPTSRTGGSIARNSLALASSRGLHRAHTPLSLSHAPCRDRCSSTHIQTTHTPDAHTRWAQGHPRGDRDTPSRSHADTTCRHKRGPPGWGRWAGRGLCAGSWFWKS